MNKAEYKPGTDDLPVRKLLGNCVDSLKHFILEQMKWETLHGPVRRDYFELLELSLLFLGGKIPKFKKKDLMNPTQLTVDTTFKEENLFAKPGADSHARWMSKALYGLKIFLFRAQFTLDAAQQKGLGEFCVFVVRFYVKAWFRCSMAPSAATVDLKFISDLIDYHKSDKALVSAVIEKISGHLWYLSEESIAMAFFDKEVSVEEKRKMVAKLRIGEEESSSSSESYATLAFKPLSNTLSEDVDKTFDILADVDMDESDESDEDEDEESKKSDEIYPLCERRIKVDSEEILKTFKKKSISEFITKKTFQFFRRFDIRTEFLNVDPEFWPENEFWVSGRKLVKDLHVVNDTAERGVKLMSEFLNLLSKDEEETEYICQVVSKNRSEYPSHNIKDLVAS